MATSRGSSVHFKPLRSPILCEAHNRRAVNPKYLLPEKAREPNLIVRDGDVVRVYAQKMALASGRARATKGYSPLKEGVVNLADEPPEKLSERMERWCIEYERITGERVVACVVHRDEGRIASDGTVHRNVHAHVVVDRTDERGRVVNSIPDGKGGTRRTTITDRKAQGRLVQDMTARVTGLARGEDARDSKRRHIDHHSYRALARQGRLRDADRERDLANRTSSAERERDAAKADAKLNGSLYTQVLRERERAWTERDAARATHAEARAMLREIGAKYGVTIERGTKAEYGGLREAMKASGQASQQEYQQIKAAFDALQERQEVARRRRKRRPGIEGRASDDDRQGHAAKAQWTRERDEVARMTIWKDSQGREVLHVTRSRVEVLDHSRDVERVALRIAAKKFGDAVSITGSGEFRERMARLAAREGIEVADADLAQIVEDERQRMTQPKRPTRSDPTTARLAAWWNPKSRGARLAALDAAQEAGYTRTPTGAWHAMRDAAEHQASADQAVLERLDREEGQIRIQDREPEPERDDEQDFGR
ncbi:MAG: hypothetical protein HIU85_06600 [Proteobacteria bacterium]|nr:hypothetical protein [Pseudomonadota bacterium]